MREKLNKLLAYLDTAGGSLFSRFYNPDYVPVSEDVNEAIDRISSLLDYNARLTETYCRVDKEADWLAEQLLCCTDDNRVDTCNYESCRRLCTSLVTTEGWRKAAREAVIKTNPKE